MNRILRCDWLPEWALPTQDVGFVPQENFLNIFWCFIPYNKSFIDQACSFKMAGYWPQSFFVCLWTKTKLRSTNMQKKELGQYPAILTSCLVNNPHLVHSTYMYLTFYVQYALVPQLIYFNELFILSQFLCRTYPVIPCFTVCRRSLIVSM